MKEEKNTVSTKDVEKEKNTVSTKDVEKEISKACDEAIDATNAVIGFLFFLFVIVGTIYLCL